MKMAGGPVKAARKGRLIAVVIIVLGALALWYAYSRSSRFPSTDDASLDADVVHVAARVGGRIISVPVSENQHVHAGDILFEIDPETYRLAVAQTQADLELAQAGLATRRRTVVGEKSTAAVAAEQVKRAQQNYDLAARTVARLQPLAAKGYVPQQQYDQAMVAERDASVSLTQALEQQRGTSQTIGDDADGIATVHAREAALAIAQHSLDDTVVRAPFDGYVTGLHILPGETVAPGQSIFTLIHDGEWFAVANFRETTLDAIKLGDCATVYSMIDRRQALKGAVVGIGAGVADTDSLDLPRGLPFVLKSVNWVRVAQRFPVRVKLDNPPGDLVRIGASALVEIQHGHACR